MKPSLVQIDADQAPVASSPMSVVRAPPFLVVRFAEVQRAVSWAIVHGGLVRTSAVAWLQVNESELRPPVDATRFLRTRLDAAGFSGAVGLMTSRDVTTFVDVAHVHRHCAARCVATVGLGNALRAGDPPGPAARIGTINVLCHVSVPLSDEALLEALALAAEGRTLAVREARVASRVTGKPASGTGTDCIVIAAPETGRRHRYAGKHTAVGHVVGHVVYDAVRRGVEKWRRER